MISGGSLVIMELEEIHKKTPKETYLSSYQSNLSSAKLIMSQSMCSENFNSYKKSYSKSSCTMSVFDYIWQLEHFATFYKSTPIIYSAAFPETALYKIRMESCSASTCDTEINFYILCENSFRGICEVSVIESENKIPCTSVTGYILSESFLYKTTEQALLQHVHEGTLTLNFTITVFHDILSESMHVTSVPLFTGPNIIDKYKQVTTNEDFSSQVVFKSQNNVYEISEELLYAIESSYFMMICQKNRQQAKGKTSSIEITMNDMSDVFIIMLNFIKTGSLPESVRNDVARMSELLIVAYRYDVKVLKNMCEEYLIHNITVKNVSKYLELAITSHATILEEHVIYFIKFHFEEVVKTEQFQHLPHLYLKKIMQTIQQFSVEKQELPVYKTNTSH